MNEEEIAFYLEHFDFDLSRLPDDDDDDDTFLRKLRGDDDE